MPEASSCIGCLSNEGAQLRLLSGQYATAGEWLLKNDGLGTFSANAVRTTAMYYDVGVPPDHPSYGSFTRLQRPPDLVSDLARQTAPLDPAKVRILVSAHSTRLRAMHSFDMLDLKEKRHYAQAAGPLICALLCEAAAKEPVMLRLPAPSSQRSAAELLADTATVKRQASLCRPLNDPDIHSLRRLHWLDQGPYRAAQHALTNCSGPWLRILAESGWSGRIELDIRNVCPQSERNDFYYDTQEEIMNQQIEP